MINRSIIDNLIEIGRAASTADEPADELLLSVRDDGWIYRRRRDSWDLETRWLSTGSLVARWW